MTSPAPPMAGGSGTTTIDATVFLPARLPGERFPLILHSHGWGGQKKSTAENAVTAQTFFSRAEQLAGALRQQGYVVVSFSQRGWGSSGGQIRVMDPMFETVDAMAVIDALVARAQAETDPLPILLENGNDPVMGTIGVSYGGGFQLLLAALDPRVDAIAPLGTWHDLTYSLLPQQVLKSGFGNLLCAVSQTRSPQQKDPLLIEACNLAAPPTSRTEADLRQLAQDGDALIAFFYEHGLGAFKDRQARGEFTLRPIDALLVQGMRDVLFNFNEAWMNYEYLRAAGGEVVLSTNQGGHMNPLANQTEGSDFCGAQRATDLITDWFNVKLKGMPRRTVVDPPVCISLDETQAVMLDEVPVGGLGEPANQGTFSLTVTPATTAANRFVPIRTIEAEGLVLAGVPRLSNVSVGSATAPIPAPVTPIAYVSVAVRRGTTVSVVDDQVTGIVAGSHPELFLPGVGEALQPGDQVGLLFKVNDVQFQELAQQRDQTNAFSVSGTVALPIFAPTPEQRSVRP